MTQSEPSNTRQMPLAKRHLVTTPAEFITETRGEAWLQTPNAMLQPHDRCVCLAKTLARVKEDNAQYRQNAHYKVHNSKENNNQKNQKIPRSSTNSK